MNLNRFLKQKCVWWAKSTPDAYGNTSYSTGVELLCRWEGEQAQVFTSDGQEVVTNNHLLLVQLVSEGDLLREGTLVAWTALSVTTPLEGENGVIRAKRVAVTPDLRAKNTLYEVWG